VRISENSSLTLRAPRGLAKPRTHAPRHKPSGQIAEWACPGSADGFFEGFAGIGVVDAAVFGWVPGEGVEDQASASREHLVLGSHREECADLAALAAFACDFDGEVDHRLDRRLCD
jgi:hypothetical protein